jgi:opacity protein-like surface antigen
MRRITLLLLGLVLSLPAAEARAGDLQLRLGALFPRADTGAENDLFRDANELFTRDATLAGVDSKDWIGVTGGAEYSFRLGEAPAELGFHVDGYGRTLETSYRDFTDASGNEVFQTLKLSTVPTGVTLRLVRGLRGSFQAYAGGGVDAVWYRYEEFGDFIDFFEDDLPVFSDSFLSQGWAFGAHVVAGVRIPINYDFAITAEGRYLWAEKEMGGDFRLNRIDLTGASVTVGVMVRF